MSLDVKKFIAGLHDYLGRAISPLTARMNALEGRLNVLEQQKGMNFADIYRGSWQPNNRYSKGQFATFNGSLWLALAETTERPGNVQDWRLIVQRGRDGKDAAA